VRGLTFALAALACLTAAGPGFGATPTPSEESGAVGGLARDPYLEPLATLAVGRGLRFNNPFRLETELGDDAESLSLTATYLDLGFGMGFGDPLGVRHGALLNVSLALEGVTQEVVTPSYLLLYPLLPDLTVFGRAGIPLVLEPDFTTGIELGAGAVWFVTGGAGITAELAYSVFFGAATWERDPSVIPVVSLELGAWFEYEVLP
jgi:hypothetical protein